MSKDKSEQNLKDKIKDLEKDLSLKEAELVSYRLELAKANQLLEKVIADMGQEVKLAALVQKLLNPTEIPNIPGIEFSTKFLPGMKSGGDYFDIFEHDDRLKFGIILSSCSGYAMSALFLSVLMKLSAQMEARKGAEPDQVIKQMAAEIVPNIQKNDSASLFYGVIDRRNYELRYCSVGNLMGFLQAQGNENLVQLQPSAKALAKDFNEKPLTHAISLGPRDRLILCSEGVWAAQSPDHEAFGKERLSKAILHAPRSGVHSVRNEILYQVEKFTTLSDPQRDQTVVVTEVKDKVIKLAKKS